MTDNNTIKVEKRRAGRPKGSKDKKPRVRRTKKQLEGERMNAA